MAGAADITGIVLAVGIVALNAMSHLLIEYDIYARWRRWKKEK